jgi:hypothetical protein
MTQDETAVLTQDETDVFYAIVNAWHEFAGNAALFRTWIKDEYGFIWTTLPNFTYEVFDEKKFMWFKLRWS